MTSPIPGSAPTADATKAARAPRRRRPLLQRAAALALALAGWRLEGQVPAEPRFVAIVAPHTSNWDFVIGVMAMFALDLQGQAGVVVGPDSPMNADRLMFG